MPEGWIEVRIEAPVDAAELLGLLDAPDAAGGWQDHGVIRLYWPADRWRPELLSAVQAALRRLGQVPEQATVLATPLADQDWNTVWASQVTPIRIGRRVVVRPSWHAALLLPGDIELVIDPKQAFGSGHHATTQLLVERLEVLVRGGERVLDVGTGSGVLAMAALRLGAASVLGLDSDPVAIACARENAALSGCGPALELRVQTLKDAVSQGVRADLIVANLDRRTLLESAALLAQALTPNGILLLSGILDEDAADLVPAFAEAGMMVQERHEREGWLALTMTTWPARGTGPRLYQINVSDGGVPKRPVPEAQVTVEGIQGDRQRSRAVHGGPDRAVCLYSLELIEALQREGHPIGPGSAGENLTLAGLEWARLKPGSRLRIGEAVRLEITSYTAPCSLNARWFRQGNFKRISQKHRPGWSRLYARVLAEGAVRPGDPVIIEEA
ncbi:50S ribosomal protein L11 methyltransferase [Nitrospira sp. Kam-Ns4a]